MSFKSRTSVFLSIIFAVFIVFSAGASEKANQGQAPTAATNFSLYVGDFWQTSSTSTLPGPTPLRRKSRGVRASR